MSLRTRLEKICDVLAKAQHCIEQGMYLDTSHAQYRETQRGISLVDALHVINNGWREKKKDQYKDEWGAWNYAIRGLDIDDRDLRVVISFDDSNMLIITVMEISSHD